MAKNVHFPQKWVKCSFLVRPEVGSGIALLPEIKNDQIPPQKRSKNDQIWSLFEASSTRSSPKTTRSPALVPSTKWTVGPRGGRKITSSDFSRAPRRAASPTKVLLRVVFGQKSSKKLKLFQARLVRLFRSPPPRLIYQILKFDDGPVSHYLWIRGGVPA